MKKLVMIFAAAGFVLASCGGSSCITCTFDATSTTTTVCEEDYDDAGTGITWQQYVDAQMSVADMSDDITCTEE